MLEIWYGILCFMLVMFVVLEGFDIGAGMLQYVVGKTGAEHRLVIAAIGPFWSWHEVWLVGFGGTLMLAFPKVLAVSFAGFYLALMLLLWALILRGVAIEVSGHVSDPLWRTAWHFLFVGSNVVLAILTGATLGNLVRGVPLDENGQFALPLFTDFSPFGEVGILDWYTVSVAVFVLVVFAAHGANGLAHRTEGAVQIRSREVSVVLWNLAVLFFIGVSIETWQVRPELFTGMMHRPLAWLGVLGVLGGLATIFVGRHPSSKALALMGSTTFIAGLMLAGAASFFPILLSSTLHGGVSMSVYDNAAVEGSLEIALVWWPMALVLAAIYFGFIYKHYKGKVSPLADTQRPY